MLTKVVHSEKWNPLSIANGMELQPAKDRFCTKLWLLNTTLPVLSVPWGFNKNNYRECFCKVVVDCPRELNACTVSHIYRSMLAWLTALPCTPPLNSHELWPCLALAAWAKWSEVPSFFYQDRSQSHWSWRLRDEWGLQQHRLRCGVQVVGTANQDGLKCFYCTTQPWIKLSFMPNYQHL